MNLERSFMIIPVRSHKLGLKTTMILHDFVCKITIRTISGEIMPDE